MNRAAFFAGVFLLALSAQAKEKSYEKGVLIQMESMTCGTTEKGGKTIAGEILGTDSERKNLQEMLCPEYVLQGERIVYRIRPRDEKHPVLLPIGETAEYRIDKDKLILRMPEFNDKEHEYTVVSMTARSDGQDARGAKTASTR